jgi:glucose/mannose transport system permease protein
MLPASTVLASGSFSFASSCRCPLPIAMVTLIWQFTAIWNDFLFGVAFSGADSKPVTVGLNNMVNTSSSVKNYNVDMAAAIIAGLPTMLIYVLAGQYFVKGLTAGAVKG